jgi:hypothetical protein
MNVTKFWIPAIALSFGLLGCDKGGFIAEDRILMPEVLQEVQKEENVCDPVVKILKAAGIEKAKAGLDQIVAKIPEQDLEILVNGAKVYRHATPSHYSDKEISDGLTAALNVLNKLGKGLAKLGLVNTAPQLEVGNGTILSSAIGYPRPLPDRNRSDISLRDQYDGIPTFGIAYGRDAAIAGFSVVGRINTQIEKINYDVTLIYTAVTDKYLLRTLASKDTLEKVDFDATGCLKDERVQEFLKLPREQAIVSECEFGGCETPAKE